jgi:hypothetical protein
MRSAKMGGVAEVFNARSFVWSNKQLSRNFGCNVSVNRANKSSGPLEIIQQDHETAVARDTAVAQYRAKEAAMANEHARQFVEEGEQIEGEQTL